MPPVELDVTRIEQQPGLCGAATAQMILHFKGLTSTTLADQDALFAEIKLNTGGKRPLGAINAHDCPSWATQKCNRCSGVRTFTCWCTYPPALAATLNQRGPAVKLSAHNNDLDAATSVLRSLDFKLPPAVLVKNGLHWLAVAGYLPGTGDGDGELIDGRFISEIFVRDPTVGAALQSVAIDVWLDEYLAPVIQCGIFQNLVVVIAATAQTAQPGRSARTLAGGPSEPARRRKRPTRPPRSRKRRE